VTRVGVSVRVVSKSVVHRRDKWGFVRYSWQGPATRICQPGPQDPDLGKSNVVFA
jgi:hypothetical protein